MDLGAIKLSIPSHLFKPDVSRSLMYAARDYVFAFILAGAYTLAINTITNPILLLLATVVYWGLQGTVFWAMFTVGHDCGHGSFSRSTTLNDVVGTIVHGFILVPYYPWKMSHHHHHKNTGNIDQDEIFHPIRTKDQGQLMSNSKFVINNYFLFGFGWLAYLVAGYAGNNYEKNYEKAFHSHFNPFDKMWVKKSGMAAISIAFVLSVVSALLYTALYVANGLPLVVAYYVGPWFVFATWLVVVTFLHHASEDTKWLSPSEWTYTKGQLENTTDRTYGAVFDHITHDIGTHVVHHLFPIIPHYHLVEANKHLKKYTTENNLPHKEVLGHISGLGEFMTNADRYKNNLIIADDALEHSIHNKNEKKMK